MTALELNADIYRNLGVIAEDEGMLKRGAEYVRRLAKQMTDDPNLMTKEEFYARVDEAAKGKSARLLPGEDLTDFLRRQGKTKLLFLS